MSKNLDQIKSKILTLRTRQQLQLEEMDGLLKEIESLSSSKPIKRRNLKKQRIIEAENYLIKRSLRQNVVTNKTLKF